MKTSELREEISIELEAITKVVAELTGLLQDLQSREPTVRERTAAAAFLSHFYNGIENILKRISYYHNVPLPAGETWHVEIFKRFCFPSFSPFPALFDDSLAAALAPFRKFRHVFYHGYGFYMDWDRMQEGIMNVGAVFTQFKANLHHYLQSLQ